MTTKTEDPFSLKKIEETLVYMALAGGFLKPLRSFFQRMKLDWGASETAHACLVGKVPVITLGREFFAREVKTEREAAEVVLHEIMHHIFLHLLLGEHFKEQGYCHSIQNLAEDAVINAYLHSVGCAGFMKRYYQDKGQWAFLRPDSASLSDGEQDRQRQKRNREFNEFYSKLYWLQISLEASLEFFKKNFPQPDGEQKFLGGATGSSDSGQGRDGDGKGRGQGNIFDAKEARGVLQALGVCAQTRNNFLKIVRKVGSALKKQGIIETGTTESRRLPNRLCRRDLINVARGRYLFTRADYCLREVWIFFDSSGSMNEYLPFVIDLTRTLKQSEFKVHCVCWANLAEEISVFALQRGEFPQGIGCGTEGEQVAQFIARNRISEAVIVTDNAAGPITTPISAKVHLCLVQGATEKDSFLNRAVVPKCKQYRLELTAKQA